MANKPVLLVGVGGIGSKIVAAVSKSIPEDFKKKVITHIFDTDINGIKSLGLKEEDVTVTSRDTTVERCIEELKRKNIDVTTWFPNEDKTIKNMKFIDGAGQVRVISRLAYYDAISRGELTKFEVKLSKLLELSKEAFDEDVRVIVVSSLAGGTGSGIFIQAGLFIKDYFEKRNRKVNIRGAFMLPDVLINNNIITGNQVENVRVNGYASVKELTAIIRSVQGGSDRVANVELAYKPDMEDEKISELPFDQVYLYDYENSKDEHLTNYQHYLEQISKIVFLQTFSDIAAKSSSDEINQLVELSESNGEARFIGAGVSTLEYPYENIVKFSANKIAIEYLDKKWLKIDNIFQNEMDQFDNLKRSGIQKAAPNEEIRLNELLEAEVENKELFFKNVWESLHVKGDEDTLIEKKSAFFFRELGKKIKNDLEKSREYDEFKRYKEIDEVALNNKDLDEVRRYVSDFESAADRFRKLIEKTNEDKKNLLLQAVTPIVYMEERDIRANTFQLAYHLFGKDGTDPMNPLASRYFAFEVKGMINSELEKLKKRVAELEKSITYYPRSYGETQSASEVASGLKKGFFGMSGPHKQFANDFREKAPNQLKNLEEYLEVKVKIALFEDILSKTLNHLISNEREFFTALKEMIVDFNREIKNLGEEHQEGTNISKKFVLGEKAHKEMLYKEVSRSIDPENALKSSFVEILKEKFEKVYKTRNGAVVRQTVSVKDIYKNRILDAYISEIDKSGVLNIGIIRALRKEAELKGMNEDDYILKEIRETNRLAKPWTSLTSKDEISLWGINDMEIAMLSEGSRKELFDNKEVESAGFSRNEIIKYVAVYNLKAQDFRKFYGYKNSSEQGIYYKAYRNRVQKLVSGDSSVTPHLDKNWHSLAYMNEITIPDNLENSETEDLNKAFIFGLLNDWLRIREVDSVRCWNYQSIKNVTKPIEKNGREVHEKLGDLYEGLQFNPYVIDEILSRMENQKSSDNRNYSDAELEKHQFFRHALSYDKNIFDILVDYYRNTSRSELEKAKAKITEILDSFFRYSKSIVDDYYGMDREKLAAMVLAGYYYTLYNTSKAILNSDPGFSLAEDLKDKVEAEGRKVLDEAKAKADISEFKNFTKEDLIKELKK